MQMRDILTVLGVIVLVLLVVAFLGLGMMGWGGMMGPGMTGWYYGPGYAPWLGIVMLLFWLLIIGGVGLLVVWLIRQGSQTLPREEQRGETALEILKRRYARGEISKEQFDQMRRDLE